MQRVPPPRSRSFDGVIRGQSNGNNRATLQGTQKINNNNTINRSAPQRSRSFDRTAAPPQRSRSFDRTAPQRSKSFDRAPPPRSRSFDRPPQQRGQSVERVAPARSRSFDRAPQQRGRSVERVAPQRSLSHDGGVGRRPPPRSRSWDGIQNRQNNNSNDPTKPTTPQRQQSNDGSLNTSQLPEGQQQQRGRRRRGRMRHTKSMRRLGKRIKSIRKDEGCTFSKCFSYLVPLTILLGCSGGLIYFTGNLSELKDLADSAIDRFIPDLSPDDLEDPFAGDAGSVPRWNNDGSSGLELTFLNALEDKWTSIFLESLSDWDLGIPDSLTLDSERVDYDYECSHVEGKVKVCNGDYGDSKWRGINSALIDGNNYITASAARMNEFYLEFDAEGAKQYTMCHEMGHALGLPHSDEDFENEDLGNCMDYTNNFDDNKHPDEMNYEFLLDLYGSIGLRTRRRIRKNNRFLRERKPLENGKFERLRHKMIDLVGKLERRVDNLAHNDGWILLHKSKHAEIHEIELEDGYKVRVQMMLASSSINEND